MSIPIVKNKTGLSTWQAESLRVTCFPSSATELNTANWWQDVIGEQPENTVVRARDGFRQDEGTVNSRKVVLGIQPNRIDWLMRPNEEGGELTIGSFQDSLDSFLELMSRWFKISPSLRRLAFGVVLALPVDNRKSGYELIANFLPNVKLDPIGSSDFLYQINRTRNSQLSISELEINRLSKWSVAKQGLARIDLLPEARVSLFPSSDTFSSRLELDINTSADYKDDLPMNKIAGVFLELVDLAKEIALKGDIP
ncbi:MAG: hypothetical protein Q8L41_04050 [Anaerolineales bacterium]|nr:hypothetical protein [Anaerolineales bacterium]